MWPSPIRRFRMKGKSCPLKIGGGGKIWTGKETVRGTLIGQWSNSTSLAEAGDFGRETCRNPFWHRALAQENPNKQRKYGMSRQMMGTPQNEEDRLEEAGIPPMQ